MREGFFRLFQSPNAAKYTGLAVFFLVIFGLYIWVEQGRTQRQQSALDRESKSSTQPQPLVQESLSHITQHEESGSNPSVVNDDGRSNALEPILRSSPPPVSKVTEARNAMVLDDLTKVKQKMSDTESRLTATTERIQSLLVSEDGARIAQDVALVEKFISLQLLIAKTQEQVEETQREFNLVQLGLDEFLASKPSEAIPTNLSSRLPVIKQKVDNVQLEIASRDLGLAAIVSESAVNQVANKTLQVAIQDLKMQKENERLALQTEARNRANQQQDKEIESLQEELAAKDSALKKEQLRGQIQGVDEKIQGAKVEQQLAAERAKLEVEFKRDWPQIQHYLGPLFLKTTKQPGGSVTIETKEAMPVSLAALKRHGLANSDMQKACSSLLLFFSYFDAGGRGRGPYPAQYHGGYLDNAQMDAIRPAYNFLDRYGLLLVEKGLLSD